MQFLDSNDFNVRTAVYLLSNDEVEIVLIPVIHVGLTEFYAEVSKELDKCDTILFEGVGLKGLKGLSNGYRRLAKRLGLVAQKDALLLTKYKGKLVHADFGGESAEMEFRKIPLIGRILFKVVYPIGFFFLSYSVTLRQFARSFRKKEEIDDQFWFMKVGRANSVDNFIKTKRDNIILKKLSEQLGKSNLNGRRIGVLYGAGHMKTVSNFLMKEHKFRIQDSWFLTVFWISTMRFNYRRQEKN